MEILKADSAGFCFGVKRAVDAVYENIESKEKLYTYGPIIHNDEVVKDLESKGVTILSTPEELVGAKDGTVIIRSHGVSKEIIDLLEENNIDYIDMTCPFVKRIHNTVYKESEDKNIIIIGNPVHPEVVGIMGWSRGKAFAVEKEEDVSKIPFPKDQQICVVSQTTFNYNKFQELVEILQKNSYYIYIVNTICDATRKRQSEAKEIASKVDAMIVIGDKKSSNSKKLYEICGGVCEKTQFIQSLHELNDSLLQGASQIGITAGASTPNNIIEEVQNYVRINF